MGIRRTSYTTKTPEQIFKMYFIAAAACNIFGALGCFNTFYSSSEYTKKKWLGALAGLLCSSAMLAIVYVLCNVADVLALGVVIFILYYIGLICIGVFYNPNNRKTLNIRQIIEEAHIRQIIEEARKSYSQTVLNNYQMIDNMWSWTKDDGLYQRLRSFETDIKDALEEISKSINKMPINEKEKQVMNVFGMLQGFALSLVLVMNLSQRFQNEDLDSVTKAMIEVLMEQGYLGEEAPTTECIDLIIANLETIVIETEEKLLVQ